MLGVAHRLVPFEKDLARRVGVQGGVTLMVRPDGVATRLRVEAWLDDPSNRVRVPHELAVESGRFRDEIWKETCAEVFLATGAQTYEEFNFALDGDYAHYLFSDYRDGMTRGPGLLVAATTRRLGAQYLVSAEMQLDPGPLPLAYQMAWVVVTDLGTVHLALQHPAGQADFHQRDLFVDAARNRDPH